MRLEQLRKMSPEERKQRCASIASVPRDNVLELICHLSIMAKDPTFSLSAFLKGLGYRKTTAWRYVTVAKLMAQFPLVGEYLVDGRLSMAQICAMHRLLRGLAGDIAGFLEQAMKHSASLLRGMVDRLHGRCGHRNWLRIVSLPGPPEVVSALVALGYSTGEERDVYELKVTLSSDASAKLGRLCAQAGIPLEDPAAVIEACLDRALEGAHCAEAPMRSQVASSTGQPDLNGRVELRLVWYPHPRKSA